MTERVSCAKCGRCMGVTPINGCRIRALLGDRRARLPGAADIAEGLKDR